MHLVNQNPPLTTGQVEQPPAKKSRTEDPASGGQSREQARGVQENMQEETGNNLMDINLKRQSCFCGECFA